MGESGAGAFELGTEQRASHCEPRRVAKWPAALSLGWDPQLRLITVRVLKMSSPSCTLEFSSNVVSHIKYVRCGFLSNFDHYDICMFNKFSGL